MKIRAFWWDRHANFGDALNPILLQHFGYEVEQAPADEADVCCVGSVLELVGPEFSGAIVGSGFVADGPPMPFPYARILALRGPLSAARAGVMPDVLADPGLLCASLVPPRAAHVRIGVVPHFKDKALHAVLALAERDDVKVIDVQADALSVLAEIAECEIVLSSSLHGLIAADVYGAASGWLKLSDFVIGEGFKFRDYGMSIGAEFSPLEITGLESADSLAKLATKKFFDRTAKARSLEMAYRAIPEKSSLS